MNTRSQPQAKSTPSNSSTELTGGLQRRYQQRVPAAPTDTVTQASAAFPSLSRMPLRTLSTPVVQTKLMVGSPNDKYEQEADRVAEQVMRMPASGRAIDSMRSHLPTIQRKCAKCDEEQKLQAKEVSGTTPEVTPAIASRTQSLQSGGQPLPRSARNFFEPRFGQDFSQVRVHTDNSARALQARAYTVGRTIVFDTGQYSPDTARGRSLLAHELTHVVQQRGVSPLTYSSEQASNLTNPMVQTKVSASGSGSIVQRACGSAAIGTPAGCIDLLDGTFVSSPNLFRFRTGCDEFEAGQEAALISFARSLPSSATVEIHGYASTLGSGTASGRAFNQSLGCARALAAKDTLIAPSPAGGGLSTTQVTSVVNHGEAPGPADERQSVVIQANIPTPQPTVHSAKVSAVSFLSCAPCNPYTDDGSRGVSPPATEPSAGFRMKHSLIASFTTTDGIHIDSGTTTTARAAIAGVTSFCGTTGPAHVLTSRGPFGNRVIPASVHGEGVEISGQFITQLGATVPATLPGAPCGFLGTNTMIPPIANQFRMRLFADGHVDSEFVSASSFPFHYLYENGSLKMSSGSPVSPQVDFNAWATSTGVPLTPALAGFKALREACCTGQVYLPCNSICVGGLSVPLPIPGNATRCVADGAAKLVTPCPSTCAPAGGSCSVLSRPANP